MKSLWETYARNYGDERAQGNLRQLLAEKGPGAIWDPALHCRGPEPALGPRGVSEQTPALAVPSVSSSSFNWYLVSAGTDVSSEIWAVLWELVTGVTQCPCKINYTLYF